jgi:hypothetical protein
MIWTAERLQKAREEAESWLGVPHVDRRCSRQEGIDCVHYLREILVAAGVVDRRDLPPYPTAEGLWSRSDRLLEALEKALHVVRVGAEEAADGDIVVGRTWGASAHVGFLLDGQLYHALAGRCVLKSPWAQWRARAEAVLRLTDLGWNVEPSRIWVER